jgi:hypothetical protein
MILRCAVRRIRRAAVTRLPVVNGFSSNVPTTGIDPVCRTCDINTVLYRGRVDQQRCVAQSDTFLSRGFSLWAAVAVWHRGPLRDLCCDGSCLFCPEALVKYALPLTSVVATLILGFIIANVAIGSYLWIFTEFSQLLVSGIADAIILFSILWTGRTISALLAQGISRPLLMVAGLLRGLGGCIAGAALATTIARIQAGALDGFDDVHRFYILVVPAIAGFGWCAPRPSRPSLLFTGTSFTFAALLVLCAVSL